MTNDYRSFFVSTFTYARVVGELVGDHRGSRSLKIFNIQPIYHPHEIYFHILHSIFDTLVVERGPPVHSSRLKMLDQCHLPTVRCLAHRSIIKRTFSWFCPRGADNLYRRSLSAALSLRTCYLSSLSTTDKWIYTPKAGTFLGACAYRYPFHLHSAGSRCNEMFVELCLVARKWCSH